MVPAALLHKMWLDLNSTVIALKSRKDQLDKEAVVDLYHKEALEMLESYKVDINRELQCNDICYQNTKGQTIEQNKLSLYGKSLVDLYFYDDGSSGIVSSAVIKKLKLM